MALRLADLPAYTRSLGYCEDLTLSKTLQATPMRHRGVHVGNFFLAEKEGGREFTSEDETVRAEEIELSVPDGRSVTTLVNATPIHSAHGTVESVVVTVQDLAPLEDLERLRAEFLGMVSHELRAPLTSIKGSAATVLNAKPELDPAEMREFFRIVDEQADAMRALIGDLLDVGRIDSGTLSVYPEPTDVADLVDRARNTFLSGGGRHSVLIDLPPDLPRALADRRRRTSHARIPPCSAIDRHDFAMPDAHRAPTSAR